MAFAKTKGAFQSLTINASLGVFIVALLGVFGVHLSPDILPILDKILVGIGAAIAIYGRIRADTLIE